MVCSISTMVYSSYPVRGLLAQVHATCNMWRRALLFVRMACVYLIRGYGSTLSTKVL
jgi:hypothetical protein